MPQITTARLRAIDRSWRSSVNKYRGPIPAGLAIAHIVAESNGDATPIVRDTQRSTGLMRIPLRIGRQYGYDEAALKKPLINLYVWCAQTNKDSGQLHTEYAESWTQPNYDFWLSLRLIFKLGFTNYRNVAAKVVNTATPGQLTSTIQAWVRTEMPSNQHFGTFRARDLRRTMDELDKFRYAMSMLDGPNKISEQFSLAPWLSPGGEFGALSTLGV